MVTIPELRKKAEKFKDTDTDLYQTLNGAADTIEELCRQIDGTVRVAADALKRAQPVQ